MISGCVQVGQPRTRAVEDSITGSSWETGSGNFADQKGARDAFTKVTISTKVRFQKDDESSCELLFWGVYACFCFIHGWESAKY